MRVLHKILINLIVAVTFFVIFYLLQTSEYYFNENLKNITYPFVDKNDKYKTVQGSQELPSSLEIVSSFETTNVADIKYNIWCIFTKVTSHAPMKRKFHTFVNSLMEHTIEQLSLHIITDHSSRDIAEEVMQKVKELTQKHPMVLYYDVDRLAEELQDIVSAMQPHFSSQPGTYYSDALFFLSLGLHRIARDQQRAAMFDADTKLKAGVGELFQQFDRFGADTLFGLAPELTPVYRHVLYLYRSRHRNTRFGEPQTRGGFPGLNSGVILFQLDRMRESSLYNQLLQSQNVTLLANKYSFKGHLGDQDFYTLMAMEHPQLIHMLPCTWNRQLCTWWRDHGYREVFEAFAHCNGTIRLYHGNCNTPIPND